MVHIYGPKSLANATPPARPNTACAAVSAFRSPQKRRTCPNTAQFSCCESYCSASITFDFYCLYCASPCRCLRQARSAQPEVNRCACESGLLYIHFYAVFNTIFCARECLRQLPWAFHPVLAECTELRTALQFATMKNRAATTLALAVICCIAFFAGKWL